MYLQLFLVSGNILYIKKSLRNYPSHGKKGTLRYKANLKALISSSLKFDIQAIYISPLKL